jgi:hypothetical protein
MTGFNDAPLGKADPLGGLLPQEIVTGDVLRGYGPRRGNLERLLRYWRPIMRKPGGFRRCRVILANHPELYPLNNICAWLHHETTGLWPNEGCHHPGMKNCKKKMRKLTNWTDAEFASHLRGKFKKRPMNSPKGKSAQRDNDMFFYDFEEYDQKTAQYVVTESDVKYATEVLSEFAALEEKFTTFLGDDKNWEIIGTNEDGQEVSTPAMGKKSLDDDIL